MWSWLKALPRNSRSLREQFGLLLAAAAVACLSTAIILGTRTLPVRESRWEQSLFGDLSDVPDPSGELDAEPQPESSSPPPGHLDLAPPARQSQLDPPEEVVTAHYTTVEGTRDDLVQPAGHQHAVRGPAVWFRGSIEELGPLGPASAAAPSNND
jgi:hypothetical protein